MLDCLVCEIVAGSLPCEKVIETSHYMAFKDIHPKAPVHVLIVPKRHIERPEELRAEELAGKCTRSQDVAQILEVKESGYRLVFNVGSHAGQEIDHAHLHLLGGTPAKSMY